MPIYSVVYGHFDEIYCTEGQTLVNTSVLGLMGNTGYSFGAHLHLAIVPGVYYEQYGSNQVPGLGGTLDMLNKYINENGGKLFSSYGVPVPYVDSGGWLSYEGHYAQDMYSSGSGPPIIIYNQNVQGLVASIRDYGNERTGKTVMVHVNFPENWPYVDTPPTPNRHGQTIIRRKSVAFWPKRKFIKI